MIGRRAKRLALIVCAVALVDQGLQHLALTDGWLAGKRIAPFDPPIFASTQARRLETLRTLEREGRPGGSIVHAELGWCPKPGSETGLYLYDELGARVLRESSEADELRPSEEPPATSPDGRVVAKNGPLAWPTDGASALGRRIVVNGCSYARGDEVEARHSWVGRLELDGHAERFVNLGVGSYGIDQAWLRWKSSPARETADECWLVVMPTALLRLSTAYPPLSNHWTLVMAFKPRFVADAPEPRLVANPAPTPGVVLELLDDQTRFLAGVGADDPWIARVPAAYSPRGSNWLHHSGLARLALTWLDGRDRAPGDWFERDASGLRDVATAIVQWMRADAAALPDCRFRLLVLPCRDDLEARASNGGRGWWEDWTRELVASGVECLDLSEALTTEYAFQSDAWWMPGRHYSPKANELVARVVREAWLRD